MPAAVVIAAEYALRHLIMNPFRPGTIVLIPARVVRMRGTIAEMQLEDGQLVRTPGEKIMRPEEIKNLTGGNVEQKAQPSAPENKAVTTAAQNKSAAGGKVNKRR